VGGQSEIEIISRRTALPSETGNIIPSRVRLKLGLELFLFFLFQLIFISWWFFFLPVYKLGGIYAHRRQFLGSSVMAWLRNLLAASNHRRTKRPCRSGTIRSRDHHPVH